MLKSFMNHLHRPSSGILLGLVDSCRARRGNRSTRRTLCITTTLFGGIREEARLSQSLGDQDISLVTELGGGLGTSRSAHSLGGCHSGTASIRLWGAARCF